MSLSSILFLFLTHFGTGLALTLLFVSREAGVKFFRFNSGIAALLIAAGFAFWTPAAVGVVPRIAVVALLISEAVLVLYWSTVGRRWPGSVRGLPLRRALLPSAAAAGVVALVAQAFIVPLRGPLPGAVEVLLIIISFLSSALLLGTGCGAMILGHWYLVIPSLDVSHLQSVARLHIASLIVRAAVVAAAVFLAIATWQPGFGPNFERYILSVDGIFFWQRILFGLAVPAVLSYMTWETAKIRSTQSATGILYVDLFTIMVGEVLAKYLLLSTSVPV